MQYFKVMLSRSCYIIQAWFMIGYESVWKCSKWILSLLFQKPISNIIVNLQLIRLINQYNHTSLYKTNPRLYLFRNRKNHRKLCVLVWAFQITTISIFYGRDSLKISTWKIEEAVQGTSIAAHALHGPSTFVRNLNPGKLITFQAAQPYVLRSAFLLLSIA